MEITISLHGKRNGFIRITQKADEPVTYTAKGLSAASLIYAVTADGQVTPITEKINSKIIGILIVENGTIIMEGRVRFAQGSNSCAKRILMQKLQKSVQNPATNQKSKPSQALTDILQRSKQIFDTLDTKSIHIFNNAETPSRSAETTSRAVKKRNLFSDSYPNSNWRKIQHRRGGYHYEGVAQIANERLYITAIPTFMYSEAYFTKNGFFKTAVATDGTVYRMKIKR